MEEVFTSAQKDNTVWQPRASSPELEAEFLRRLMVKLGVSQEESKALIAAKAQAPATPNARVITANNAPAVQLSEDFDRAWRRVGLALDRTGFTVEDRDRTKGVYFVRYIDPTIEKKEPGFFGKLFGSSTPPLPTSRYQVVVRSEAQASTVAVLDANGGPVPADAAKRIVQVIADELK